MVLIYFSMGLINEDGGEQSLEKVNSAFRLDSILIRGLNNMSTDEIFKYLHQQGLSPKEMEWVNDACCKFTIRKYSCVWVLFSQTGICRFIIIYNVCDSRRCDLQG